MTQSQLYTAWLEDNKDSYWAMVNDYLSRSGTGSEQELKQAHQEYNLNYKENSL